MIQVKNYQLLKVTGNKNFKRICNEIKKIDPIKSVSIENSKNVIHIEYDSVLELSEQELFKIEELILRAIHEYEKKAMIIRIDNKEKYRKVLYLKNLDCAHCAARIETIAKKSLDYEQIIVDFSTGRFIIETYSKNVMDNLFANVNRIAHHVDDLIVVIDSKIHKLQRFEDEKKISKKTVITFSLGLTIFIIMSIISAFLTIPFYYYIVPYLLIGYSVLKRFFKNLFKGHILDETFLMSVASIGAFCTSHASEAVMVVALYQVGEFLQNKAINHSRRSIKDLLDFDVKTAKLKLDTEITEVDVETLMPGDIVIVNKGEIIPTDGIVVNGKTNIDTKNLTGESMLRSVDVGSEILSGSVNMGKIIEIKVTKPYGDSMISKIMDLVENATSSKGKVETMITSFAKYYTPIVVILALVISVIGSIFDTSNFRHWIYTAMEFLVISCPCALVISIPLCYFSSIGTCSRRGILVKGSNYIETLNKVENVVFDKTGTITKGVFKVVKVVPMVEELTEERLLNLLIHAEYYSNHPIGISIVDNFGRDKIFPEIITDFQDITGGAKATINGNKILVGNDKLMNANKIELPQIESCNLIVHVVKNKIYQGYVEIGDVIKEEALITIKDLHKYGKKCFMLTGDSVAIASSVAKQIDVDGYHAELLPHQKVEILEEIKKQSTGKTIFIGDGINDAPVIASADIGIAMGNTGSDATIAIADMVIMGDNLLKINEAFKIAKYTKRKVVQNIILSLTVKFIVMILAILLGFFVTKDGEKMELPLGIAIFSDVGISLLAILNSLLIMRLYHNKQDFKEVATNEER